MRWIALCCVLACGRIGFDAIDGDAAIFGDAVLANDGLVPFCGDGTCNAAFGEGCVSCPDCQGGHLGNGTDGDPCVAPEQWRCVFDPSWSTYVSQVCEAPTWRTYKLNPIDCTQCVCAFSTACM